MRDNNDQRVRRIKKSRPSNVNKPSPSTARPHAKSAYERYLTLARAAAAHGDTVESENFYQHAEHYLRLSRAQDN